jgi:hypothetical protein
MDTWILWICGCAVAYWVGQAVGKHVATVNVMLALAKDPDSIKKLSESLRKVHEAETQEELDDAAKLVTNNTGTEMTIERVGDQLYAYAKDTGQFLAQATNLASLTEAVDKRFPGQKFFGTISKDDPAKELVK